MATIVTGYFQLKQAKASHDTYTVWMRNMLCIDNPMVIFCDGASEQMIREMREGKMEKTKIIITSFNEFYSYRYARNFLEHYKMDKEQRVGHNMFLYMIWSEKSHFLKRAIELNPFSTEYFVWCDIGCFRVPNTRYLNWPSPSTIASLDKKKVLLLSVQPFTPEELQCHNRDRLPLFQFTNRIGGTIFGGGKDILLQWHDKYYEMLEHFISIGRFIGKDQSIMNSVYLLNRDMCNLVNWLPGCPDQWFYLQEYLR
jgi:hypothetical protein